MAARAVWAPLDPCTLHSSPLGIHSCICLLLKQNYTLNVNNLFFNCQLSNNLVLCKENMLVFALVFFNVRNLFTQIYLILSQIFIIGGLNVTESCDRKSVQVCKYLFLYYIDVNTHTLKPKQAANIYGQIIIKYINHLKIYQYKQVTV